MLNRGKPIFPGGNEIDQFQKICELIGKPNESLWPDYPKIEVSKKLDDLVDNEYNDIPIKFERFSESAIQLLEDMLTWDPQKSKLNEEFHNKL